MEFEQSVKDLYKKQYVKDLYKIAGMLEILSCMQDRPITEGIAADLADAVDKLELIGADLLIEAMVPEIMIVKKDNHKIDFFADDDPETEVSAHEGKEESPPGPQPADQ